MGQASEHIEKTHQDKRGETYVAILVAIRMVKMIAFGLGAGDTFFVTPAVECSLSDR